MSENNTILKKLALSGCAIEKMRFDDETKSDIAEYEGLRVSSREYFDCYSQTSKKLRRWVALHCFSRSSGRSPTSPGKDCLRKRRQSLRF